MFSVLGSSFTSDTFSVAAAVIAVVTLGITHFLHAKRENASVQSDRLGVSTPPHVRSWLPYIGSAIEMGRDIRGFITKYCNRFDTPIFTAVIGGKTCHFIAASEYVTLAYRSTNLDTFTLQTQFMRNVIGIDRADDIVKHPNAKKALDMYHKYLFTSDELSINIRTAQDSLSKITARLMAKPGVWHKRGLYDFVVNSIFTASAESLISKHVATKEMIRNFRVFDEYIPFMFSGMPRMFCSKAYNAREAMVKRIDDTASFLESASRLIAAREELLTTLDLTRDDLNRANLALLWASVGNSVPAIFWVLFHLMRSSEAYTAVRREVSCIVSDRTHGQDFFTLDELDRMVSLDSIFLESLRLSHGAFTVRDVVEDFIFDPKVHGRTKFLFKKGTRIMAYPGVLHYDPDIYNCPEQFIWDRFLSDATTGKTPSFIKDGRPIDPLRLFGGGVHLCPGRKFIIYEMKVFVATLVLRFNMRFSDASYCENSLGINRTMQGIGISHPSHDVDVEICSLGKTPNKHG